MYSSTLIRPLSLARPCLSGEDGSGVDPRGWRLKLRNLLTTNAAMRSYTTLQDRAEILVVLVPVGGLQTAQLQQHVRRMSGFSTISMQTLTPYADFNSERSAFQHLSWQTGFLRLRFIELSEWTCSQWEDLHLHHRCLIVIGFCHCPSTPNLPSAYSDFLRTVSTRFPNAITSRCCAFEMTEEQQIDPSLIEMLPQPGKLDRGVVVFPADRIMDDGNSTLSLHTETVLTNLCSDIMEHFDALAQEAEAAAQAMESTGRLSIENEELIRLITTSTYPGDPALSSLGNETKRRKRQCGRLRAWVGSRCLLVGSPLDALRYFGQAIEACKSAGDSMWEAAAHEGCSAAVFCREYDECLARTWPADPFTTDGSHELRPKRQRRCTGLTYLPAVQVYLHDAMELYAKQRTPVPSLEAETVLKLARYLASCSQKDLPTRTSAILKLLSRVKSSRIIESLGIQENILLTLDVALVCESIGLRRKFAFFVHQAAMLYRETYSWRTAHALTQLAGQHYGLEPLLPAATPKTIATSSDRNRASPSGSVSSVGQGCIFEASSEGESNGDRHGSPAAVGWSWTILRKHLLEQLLGLAKRMQNHELCARYAMQLLDISLQRGDGNLNDDQVSPRGSNHDSLGSTEFTTLSSDSTTRSDQEKLVEELQLLAAHIPQNLWLSGAVCFPVLVSVSVLPLHRIYKPTPKRLNVSDDAHQHDTSKAFTFTPIFMRESQKSANSVSIVADWVQHEVGEVRVQLQNPMSFDVCVDSITLLTSGCTPVESSSESLTIPCHSSTSVVLSARPGSSGTLEILGCQVGTYNFISEHFVNEQGQSISKNAATVSSQPCNENSTLEILNNTSGDEVLTSCKESSASICRPRGVIVRVLDQLPLLAVRQVVPRSTSVVLLEGETRSFRVTIENMGELPISELSLVASATFVTSRNARALRKGDTKVRQFLSGVNENLYDDCIAIDGNRMMNPSATIFDSALSPGHQNDSAAFRALGGVFVVDELRSSLDQVLRKQRGDSDENAAEMPETVLVAPGDSIVLTVQVKGCSLCTAAEIKMIYSSGMKSSYQRSLTVPFSLDVLPSLNMLSGRILHHPFVLPLGQLDEAFHDCDSHLSMLVMDVHNPTSSMFSLQFIIQDPSLRTTAEDELQWPQPRLRGELNLVPGCDESTTQTTDDFKTQLSSGHTFVIEGGAIKRVAVPLRRICLRHSGAEEYPTNDLDDANKLRATLAGRLLRGVKMRWKSGQGSAGELILSKCHFASSAVDNLCAAPVELSCSLVSPAMSEGESIRVGHWATLRLHLTSRTLRTDGTVLLSLHGHRVTGKDEARIDVSFTDDFVWTGVLQLELPHGIVPGASVHHDITFSLTSAGSYRFFACAKYHRSRYVWSTKPCKIKVISG